MRMQMLLSSAAVTRMADAPGTPTPARSEILQKISAKEMGFDRITIGAALKPMGDNAELFLFRIFGIINGLKTSENVKTGEIDFGLKGQFEGHRADGVKATSGVAFLPGGIQAQLTSAYEGASEKDKKATVSFAMDIYAVKASNAAGYTFKGKTVGDEPTKVDPFEALRGQAAQIALPAPTAISDADKAASAAAATARDAEEKAADEKKAAEAKAKG